MLSSTSGRFYSGHCPAKNCNGVVIFTESSKEVSCFSCKSSVSTSSLINASEIRGSGEALCAILQLLYPLNGSIPSKPEPHMIKVLGLSTYHCKLLSPLLTVYGIDRHGRAKTIHELKNCATFDCSWLGDRSFCIELDHIKLPGYGQDESGSVGYLAGTLSLLRSFNNDRDALVPLHVDGDGHCLVHAVSRAIVGRELFWHALRTGLKLHLTENLPQYKELLNDFINSSEWADIIAECDPDYSPCDNEMLGLRNIHVFGLANILRRPILLVDSVAGMQSSGDYSALFLPGLIPPEQCRDRNGELNKPICLAWSSSGRNHYIPLVGIKGCDPPLFPRSLLPKVWGVSQSMIEDYIQFNDIDCLVIGGKKTMQDSYLVKLSSGISALFHQKYGVDPSLVADTYYCNFKKGAAFDLKPSDVLSSTKLALQDRRLVRCLNCTSVNLLPLNSEWLRPHGLLYNIAKTQSNGGILQDNHIYTFQKYGITCSYNARKDMLVLEKSTNLDKCSWCESNQLRLIHFDGHVLFENGDKTETVVTSPRARCKCGFKHWYNGREYDNPPLKMSISFEWKSHIIVEEVMWFQDESDPMLNSDPHQTAAFIIHKHFPGERDTGRARHIVLDALLAKIKSSVPTATLTKPETLCSLNRNQFSVPDDKKANKNYEVGGTMENRKLSESKQGLDSNSTPSASVSKKRDVHGGALPKQRSTPASQAAAAAISRAEAKWNPDESNKFGNHSIAVVTTSGKRNEDHRQTIRLGPGYSVLSDSDSEDLLKKRKVIEDARKKNSELVESYLASITDGYYPQSVGKCKGSPSTTGSKNSSQRPEKLRKADLNYGSLSRVAHLLNVGEDRNLSDGEDILTNSDDDGM